MMTLQLKRTTMQRMKTETTDQRNLKTKMEAWKEWIIEQ